MTECDKKRYTPRYNCECSHCGKLIPSGSLCIKDIHNNDIYYFCTDECSNEPHGEITEPISEPLTDYNSNNTCPVCGCKNIDYDSMELDEKEIHYPATCTKCGQQFREYHSLSYSVTEWDPMEI